MFQILVLLFICVPLIELALLIEVGQAFGLSTTLLLVVFTGVLGAYLAKIQGLSIMQKLNRELSTGQMPSDVIFDGVLILCGGLVLLTPGLITDAIGFFLLIPAGRALIKKWIRQKIQSQFDQGKTVHIRYFKSDL